jgi:hypothetical protein
MKGRIGREEGMGEGRRVVRKGRNRGENRRDTRRNGERLIIESSTFSCEKHCFDIGLNP